jgi:hypothetical protein
MLPGGAMFRLRVTKTPPSGEYSEDDFDVLANGGRIFNAKASPVGPCNSTSSQVSFSWASSHGGGA